MRVVRSEMRERRALRRSLVAVLAMTLAFTGLTAGPVAADQPTEVTFVNVVEDLSPCRAPATTEVTQVWRLRVHEHDRHLLSTAHVDVTTADGFSGSGVVRELIMDDLDRIVLNFMVTNDETGERYTVKGVLRIDLTTGEWIYSTLRMECIRA
jgi:hypothetical protein